MRKLFLIAAALLITMGASAQNRDVEALNKKLEKSDLAIADAKKSVKFSTWADRSKLFVEFANVYSRNLIAGASIDLILPQIGQPLSIEDVVIGDLRLTKYDYPEIEVYVDGGNVIQYWSAKHDAIENPLGKAFESLSKGKEISELDFLTKGGRLTAGVLQNQYNIEGNNAYSLGDKLKAGRMFEGSLTVSELIGEIDTLTIYNAGMSYFYGGDNEKALPFFEKTLALGELKGGDIYYYISSTLEKMGRKEESLAVIEKGFAQFPQSPTVMSGIINSYMSNNKDPEKLVEIIHDAQKIDSKNVSLFITEGAIWDKIDNAAKSEEAFLKALELDPTNSTVYFNIGLVRTKERDRLISQAEKLDLNDVKGYETLIAKSFAVSKGAIEMLEKAYGLNKTEVNTVALLRELYYTLRDQDKAYDDKYKQYAEIYKQLTD